MLRQTVDGARRTLLERLIADGLQLRAGDLRDGVEALTALVRGFDAVVSAGPEALIASTERALIAACEAAGVGVFVQNHFGFDYSAPGMELALLEHISFKEGIARQLSGGRLPYLVVATGLFAEWAFSSFGGLDLEAGVISAPYSFDTRLTLTSLDTIGRSVAELLVRRVSNQRIFLASDTVSYEQIARAVEAATNKVSFRTRHTRAQSKQKQPKCRVFGVVNSLAHCTALSSLHVSRCPLPSAADKASGIPS